MASAIPRSVDASLHALEEVVDGQAKITNALAESLDASRQVVTAATSSNQHSTERIETPVSDVLAVLTGQLDALKSQVDIGRTMLSDPCRRRCHVPQDDPGLERCLWSNVERNPSVQACGT